MLDLAINTFEAVVIFLAVGLIGFIVTARNIVPKPALNPLANLALDVALPCLVFANIVEHFEPAATDNWWQLPLWWAGFTLVAGLLTVIVSFRLKPAIRTEFKACLFYQNAVFVPLVILTELFGSESREVTLHFIFVVLFSPFFFSTAPVWLASRPHEKRIDFSKALHPVVWATLLALIIKLTGASHLVPPIVLSPTRIMGNAAVPLLMVVLGGHIYIDLKLRESVNWRLLARFVITKNMLFPAVTLALLCLVRPPRIPALLILLQSAMPPITSLPALMTRTGHNTALTAKAMLASFVILPLTLPLWVALANHFLFK